MRALQCELRSRLYRALTDSMQAHRYILSCGVRGDGLVRGGVSQTGKEGEDVIDPTAKLKDLILDEM